MESLFDNLEFYTSKIPSKNLDEFQYALYFFIGTACFVVFRYAFQGAVQSLLPNPTTKESAGKKKIKDITPKNPAEEKKKISESAFKAFVYTILWLWGLLCLIEGNFFLDAEKIWEEFPNVYTSSFFLPFLSHATMLQLL